MTYNTLSWALRLNKTIKPPTEFCSTVSSADFSKFWYNFIFGNLFSVWPWTLCPYKVCLPSGQNPHIFPIISVSSASSPASSVCSPVFPPVYFSNGFYRQCSVLSPYRAVMSHWCYPLLWLKTTKLMLMSIYLNVISLIFTIINFNSTNPGSIDTLWLADFSGGPDWVEDFPPVASASLNGSTCCTSLPLPTDWDSWEGEADFFCLFLALNKWTGSCWFLFPTSLLDTLEGKLGVTRMSDSLVLSSLWHRSRQVWTLSKLSLSRSPSMVEQKSLLGEPRWVFWLGESW